MKIWKAALILCALAVTEVAGIAQQLPADKPTRQQVLSLFESIQLRRNMEQAQDAAMQNAMTVVTQMFQQNGPAMDTETRKQMDILMKGLMEDVRAVLPVSDMLEAVIPIYQRHFTSGEVEAIIAFQNSPVGRKVVDLQPVMLQESFQALGPLQQRAMPELMKRLEARLKTIVPPAPTPASERK